MKNWLLIFQLPLAFFLMGYSCRNESKQPNLVQVNYIVVPRDSTELIAFDKDILPILKARCSPCHFTGGKMYEKIPFDKSKTITDHPEGILKRFKDPELSTIKSYLDQAKK